MFALGFHQQGSFAQLPLFLAEHRRRVVIGTYAIDKELATFLGRPPRISWRHLDIELPLDVDYCDIMAHPHEPEAILKQVDSEGWNVRQKVTNITYPRILYKVGIVQELVLELSLNPKIYDDIEGRISSANVVNKL